MAAPEEMLKNLHLLDRNDQEKLLHELRITNPEIIRPLVPHWWWWHRCVIRVLIVCDGGLNFGTGGFDLSTFLTIFSELSASSFVRYRVTLAHRGAAIVSTNPSVVEHISNFQFDKSVNLADFDEVWLFGIESGGSITPTEISAIEDYMNGGGGLFATGDHGALGQTMCGSIPRVKDMRYWDNSSNEVGMTDSRRNDTNMPTPGNASALTFDHQSDAFPQTIAVRTFANGHPHPLLSISKAIRPSGIIDIMPDHPHEGECQHEATFNVNGIDVPSQIIAVSFVKGGNTAGFKAATEPHCFPSIAVWDGRVAKVGRIVVDSTWHHFVNINLNAAGSAESGLSAPDLKVIKQYFKNIAKWMARSKPLIACWRPWILLELTKASQLVEANLNNPNQRAEEIRLADLKSIGALAEDILANKFSPAFARSFLVDILKDSRPEFGRSLDAWHPEARQEQPGEYHSDWINADLLLHTAIGAGMVAVRDVVAANDSEKVLDMIEAAVQAGIEVGFRRSADDLGKSISRFRSLL